MTMPVGTGNNRQANVTVSANVDPFVSSMNLASKAATNFGGALQKIDQAVLKITKMAGATAIGGGLVSIFGDAKATQQAAAFQQSMSALAAQSAVTGSSIQGLGTNIQKLSTQVPIASNNLAQLATQVAALGVRGTAQITQLTLAATKLAAATNTAPGQLLTGLVSMSQSLGTGLGTIERYGSVLTSLQQNMGVSSQAVMDFAGGIQAVANKAGIGQASILGLSAAFSKVGADGFSGAQAFNTVMNDMADAVSRNSSRMQLYANTLGMTQKAFADLVRTNPAQAFTDFVNAIASQGSKAQAVLEEFGLDGVRTQRVFAALTSGQADLQTALNQSNAAFADNTATAKGAAAAWSTFNDKISELHNSVQVAQQALGAGFLNVLTPVVEMFGTLAKGTAAVTQGLNNIPLLGGASGWAATAAGVALASGAFAILFANITKVVGVWRVLTGVIGGQAIRGMAAGFTGQNMAPNQGASRTQMWMYRNAYNAGGFFRGRQTNITSSAQLGQMGGRSMVGRVATFPLTRAQQMWRQTANTMASPFGGPGRNAAATDPWSTYGMYQQGQAGMQRGANALGGFFMRPGASQFEQDLGKRVMNPFGGAAGVANSAQRLRYDKASVTTEAYNRAHAGQTDAFSKMSRSDQDRALMAIEAEQYAAQGVTNFNSTNFSSLNKKQRETALKRGANWQGQKAAGLAGDQFDLNLSQAETDKLANPFQKLASKVESISKQLATSTKASMGGVMNSIEQMFIAAINRISQLAKQASAYLTALRSQAAGGPAAGPMFGAGAMAGAGNQNFGGQYTTPSGQQTNVVTTLPPVPPRANTSQTLGANRTVDPTQVAQSVIIGNGSAAAAANQITTSSNKIVSALSTAGSTIGRMGSSLFAFMSSPWMIGLGVFGPLLFQAFNTIYDNLKQVTPKLAYAGAEIQQALGRQYQTPDEQADQKRKANASSADKDAFGKTEVDDAMGGNFAGSHAETLTQLGALKNDMAEQKAFLQQQINQVVRNNNGSPLDSAAQQQIRYLAIRASGGDSTQAQKLYGGLDLSGGANPNLYTGELDDFYKNHGGWATSGAGSALLGSISSSAVTDAQSGNDNSLAYVLSRAGKEGAKGDSWNSAAYGTLMGGLFGESNAGNMNGGSYTFGNVFNRLVNDYNNGKSDQAQVKANTLHGDPGDFNTAMDDLRTGNGPAQNLFDQIKKSLEDAGVKVDKLGHVSDMSAVNLDKLASAAGTATAKTLEQSQQQDSRQSSIGNAIYTSEINSTDKSGDVSSLLQNSQDVWFNSNLGRLNQNLINGDDPAQGKFSTGANDVGITSPQFVSGLQNAIVQIEKLKATLGGPSDPQWQALDKIEQADLSKLTATTSALQSPGARVVTMSDTLKQEMAAAPPDSTNVDSYQAQISAIQNSESELVSTLKQGYMAQYEYNRQTERSEEDHLRQMSIMQRDYNRQVAESNYQYQVQQAQAQHDFQVQQTEAAYSYNVQQRESRYQFNKQQEEANYQYNIQQQEAMYQYGKQQQEATYEFQYEAEQRQHSFDETIRSMKYSVANSLGTPGTLVQAKYTESAQQALAGFKQQTKDLQSSLDAMNGLQQMGLSTDFIRVFKLDDPANFAQAQKYLKDFIANPELVKSFNDAVAQNLNISQAIATNPGNSQFADLKRNFDYTAEQAGIQFQHAAQLAADAFAHGEQLAADSFNHSVDLSVQSFQHGTDLAAESYGHSVDLASQSFAYSQSQSAIAFQHSMDMAAQSFSITMGDFQTEYAIQMKRAAQDLADQFNFIQVGADTLMSWAKNSGIPGMSDIAKQLATVAADISAANAALEAARQGAVNGWANGGADRPDSSGGHNYNLDVTAAPSNGAYGAPGSLAASLSGANFSGLSNVDWAAVATALGGTNGSGGISQMGKSLPVLGNFEQGLGNVASSLGLTATNTDTASQKIAVYKQKVADGTSTTNDQKAALDKATDAIKDQVTQAGNAATANDTGRTAADKNKDSVNAQHDAFLNLTTQLGFVPPGLATLGQHLGITDASLGTTKGNVDLLHTGIANLPDHTVNISADTSSAAGSVMGLANSISTIVGQVIDKVINGGLVNAWNSVVQQLGLPGTLAATPYQFNPFIISALNTSAPSRAGGALRAGMMWTGGYTGDGGMYEPTGIVHAGEYVINQRQTRKYKPLLEAIHRGDLDHVMPGYATGGPVATWPQLDAIRKQMFPGSVLTSAYRPGANDYHGLGEAIDIGWPGNTQAGLMPIAAQLARQYPNSTELIHNPNGSIKNGQPVPPSFWGASTWAEHANHVHWAMTAQALAGGASGGAGMGAAAMDPVGYIVGQLTATLNNGGPGFAGLHNDVVQRLIGMTKSVVGPKLTGYLGQFTPPTQAYTGGGNVEALVQAIASGFGWGSGQEWASLTKLLQRESSFNPNAKNPSSTAYGLFQFLDSTWASTGIPKTSDPSLQTRAGLNYIQARYKDPIGAWAHETSAGWYGKGGIATKATLAGIGEAGPEAILPLNGAGSEFMAQTVRGALSKMGINTAVLDEIRRGRTSSYGSPARSEMHIHHTDASTNFTGDITVVAQDPNEVARKLAAQQRLRALARPVAKR